MMSDDQRLQFYKDCAMLRGDALDAKVVEAETQITTRTSKASFQGDGDWLDESEVRDKFKSRPEQADSIIKNAKHFYDPTRQVMLYEVVAYKSQQLDTEERTDESKRQIMFNHMPGKNAIKGSLYR